MGDPTTPHSLETVTGKFVDLLEPDPIDVCIEDIAWSLSRLARYNGHTIQELPYTVGQHSLVVSDHVYKAALHNVDKTAANQLALQSLLHDAAEAYTGDISGPLKKIKELRPIIKGIEHNLELAIFKALDVPFPTESDEKLIKIGDMVAQRIEAYNFMVSRGMNWNNMPEVSITDLQDFEMPRPSIEVYQRFLLRFNELKGL